MASKTPENYDGDANDGEDTEFEVSSREGSNDEEDDGKCKPISNGGDSEEEENDSAGISDSEERHPIFMERDRKRFGVIYER